MALTMLTSKEIRRFIAVTIKKKAVELIDHEGNSYWNKIESISYNERIGVGVLARYNRIQTSLQFNQLIKKQLKDNSTISPPKEKKDQTSNKIETLQASAKAIRDNLNHLRSHKTAKEDDKRQLE